MIFQPFSGNLLVGARSTIAKPTPSGRRYLGLTLIFLLSLLVGLPATANASLLSQKDWRLHYVSSQQLDTWAAVHVFDGNPNTFWHTQFQNSSPRHPHEIQIDLGAAYELDGFRYLPRQDEYSNGRIGQYEFYVSADGKNWGQPVTSGSFANNAREKEVRFAKTSGRFVRLVALSEVNGNPWTSMANLGVMGQPASGSTNATLTLRWDPNPDDVLGYRVYYGSTASNATQEISDLYIAAGEVNKSAPSVTYNASSDLGARAGDTMCFRVRAYNMTGESNPSEAVCEKI